MAMQSTYLIRIKKSYAALVIEDLKKMKAIELIKNENDTVPEWQKEEVRRSVKEIEDDPSILIDEDVVFNMLNKG
jgi:hypothetical protein